MPISPQGEVRPGLLWSEKGPYLGTVLQPRVALSTEKVSLSRGHSVSHTPYHSPQIRRNLSSQSLTVVPAHPHSRCKMEASSPGHKDVPTTVPGSYASSALPWAMAFPEVARKALAAKCGLQVLIHYLLFK